MSPRPTIAKRTPTHGPLRIDVASRAIEAARRNVPENKSNLARAVHRLVVSGTRVQDLLRDLEAAEATMTEDIAAVNSVLERGRSNRFANDATSLTAALTKINDCSAPARLPAEGAESLRYPYSPHTPKDVPPSFATSPSSMLYISTSPLSQPYQDDDFLCVDKLMEPLSPFSDPGSRSPAEAEAEAEAEASCASPHTFSDFSDDSDDDVKQFFRTSPVDNKVRGLRPLTVQVDAPTFAAVERVRVESDEVQFMELWNKIVTVTKAGN